MEQVLLVVQVIIAVGLIGLVLIQRSDSDGFGLSGGSGNNLLSGRSSANALTRITAFFAAAFIINSLALGVLAAHGSAPSIVEKIEQQSSETPAVPSVPLAGTEKKPAAAETAPEKQEAAPAADAKAAETPKEAAKKPVATQKKPAANEADHNE